MIKLRDIDKFVDSKYQRTFILKGIDLDIEQGEFVTIMGPSGAGKSTLMNLVGCLDTPTSGKYWLNGRDISALSDNELADIRNKEIGFVFQTFNLLPRSTALENVSLPLVYAGYNASERKKRAEEVLEQVGLADRMDHRPNQLSGGQRQRIAIARAILANPRVLILDEATSNLDTESESLIQESLKKLMEGRTTFVIAHRLSTIRQATQILVVEQGNIVERGTHDDLIKLEGRYYSLYTYQARI